MLESPDNSSCFFDVQLYWSMEELGQMGMYEMDLVRKRLKASPHFQKMFHLPEQEQHSILTFQALVHPDDLDRVSELFAKCVEQRVPFDCEYRCLINQQVMHVRSRSKILYDEQGNALKVYGFKQDITEQVELKEELYRRQQMAELRLEEIESIYATAPVGLCLLDTKLRVSRINQQLVDIIGLSVEAYLGKSISEVLPNLADQAEPLLHKILKTGKPIHDIEINGQMLSRPDDERIWLSDWHPLKSNQGKVIGVTIVTREVTEKRQRETAIKESEARYQRLFNSIEDGFCVCEILLDEQGKPCDYRFQEINHTFEEHTGLKGALGKTALELIPNLEPYWIETYGKVALTGESIRFEQESPVMGRCFEVYAFAFGPRESHLFALQFKDITERKKQGNALQRYQEKLTRSNQELAMVNSELKASNDELITATKQLKQINSDLDSFVYTASHDLRAPIANIHGLLNILKRKLPPELLNSPAVGMPLNLIDKSVDRFIKTISNLSDIARLQKQGNLPVESVRLLDVIEDVRMDLSLMIEESEAQLEIDVNECSSIRFAPKNLRSVVFNLLSNAIKYRDPNRKPIVRMECQEIDGYHVLTVTDNGLGMDLSQDTRLFSMFQRLHDHVEGTGVGLHIVKRIVDNAGGRIEVESQVGKGTTFKVFFKR